MRLAFHSRIIFRRAGKIFQELNMLNTVPQGENFHIICVGYNINHETIEK